MKSLDDVIHQYLKFNCGLATQMILEVGNCFQGTQNYD